MTDKPSLPDSLLTIENVEGAIEVYSGIFRTILIHRPLEGGGCSCGKVHEKSPSGSSSAGKHPIQSNWQKHEASFDELRDQLSRLKFIPNVGVVLGKQPGGGYLIAVDVDDAERFAVLEEELGPLPPTPRCDSGRGYRLFYTAPPEIDVERLKNVTALGGPPGVDVKAERGQVVVAPSLHANGKKYVWTVVGEIADLPVQWAMALLKKFEKPKFVEKYTSSTLKGSARTRAEKYLETAVNGEARALAACREGKRNDTLFRSACRVIEMCLGVHLESRLNWVQDEMLRASRACGLDDPGSRATIASAERNVREKGNFKVPAVLAEAARSSAFSSPSPEASHAGGDPDREPPPKPPENDRWGLSPESQVLGRPHIRINTDLHLNVDEAIKALSADENLYQREKKLVYVTRVTKEQSNTSAAIMTDDGQVHHQLVEGSPQICEMELATTRERLCASAVFKKWSNKEQNYVSTLPTDEIVGAVHRRKQWNGIRSIVGIVETPTMRPDGMIVQQSGYDPVTHYLYMPSQTFPDLPDWKATQANAIWAFKFLSEIFADFPYVNESHRAVPIAAILTLVARPAILGSIPAFLFDASTRGSGKTLQTDAVAMVTTGRGAPRMNYSSDDVELEKILAGYALKGSTFICLDNIPNMRAFGGGPIDRVITARDEVDLRVLGATKVLTLPWRALLMATGNNITLHGDTGRRVLMARLEPTEESPEHRTKFTHDDLLGWIRVQRPRLVTAALLILRAYILAGCPDMRCARWGSFEEWSKLVPQAIVFAGGSDPMGARPESEEEVDNDLRSIRCFMTRILELQGQDDFRISSIIELLYKCERKRDKNGIAEDGLEDLRDSIESLVGRRGMKQDGRNTAPDPVELGKRLGAFRGRVISGMRLLSKTGSGGILRWRIERISKVSIGTNVSQATLTSPEQPQPFG